jgi:hypothetical protein
MIRLPIIPKTGVEDLGGSPVPCAFELPLNYMSDFSVMGLVVSDCEQAVRVLEERYTVIRGPHGTEVLTDGTPGIGDIIQALGSCGIESGISDIVGQVYQG